MRCTRDWASTLRNARVVILAVKPKDAEAALTQARPHFARDTLLVSVVTGVSLKNLQSFFGLKRVAYAMPNVAARENCSLTALCFSRACTRQDKRRVQEIFGLLGETLSLSERDFMAFMYADACGIAIVSYLVQALFLSFNDLGLSEKLSLRVTRALLRGTASLADTWSFEEIIGMVKTKRGYTERLLQALDQQRVAKGIRRAYEKVGR
ncbi:MAG TPA: hypothetical protein HA252_05255 [Candidatus Diapherotrites archaeon]|uniref:Pyrroline-5-carboxylate reductase dimerisation domain-containing protein n=1 Tax=Candidatus Iainarchaeum sp. TaxID=3101447 RepID=A0A7J4JGG3_9ARCH|nr:hypothetical protein [Candidatus Diapherotrites archaeon]HIH16788.1 hypothetical protein [Candidatus Diapherotrites archaeon]